MTISLLTAIWNVPSIGAVGVSSETLALSDGLIRYHYDVEFDQQCETVLLIGFGTAMTVQYRVGHVYTTCDRVLNVWPNKCPPITYRAFLICVCVEWLVATCHV